MEEKYDKIIAVDFDGTLCENKWPDIGKANEYLIYHLRKEKENGRKIILWTCRTGDMLDKAVKFCNEHDLYFDAVNENLPEIIKSFGSDTRKIFANEYIDDRAVKQSFNTCIMCGDEVPEGRQICWACEKQIYKNNIEKEKRK